MCVVDVIHSFRLYVQDKDWVSESVKEIRNHTIGPMCIGLRLGFDAYSMCCSFLDKVKIFHDHITGYAFAK